MYAGEGSDLENRIKNFNKQFLEDGEQFFDMLPPFVEDEVVDDDNDEEVENNDETGERKRSELFVGVILEDAMRSLSNSQKLDKELQ